MAAFSQILSTSSFIKHPTIQRCMVQILTAPLNNLRNELEVSMAVTFRVAAS
jgi:hypothetical protein